MISRVLVFPEGSVAPLRQWTATLSGATGITAAEEHRWQDLCVFLVSHRLPGESPRKEVVICLPSEEVLAHRDKGALAQLLTIARENSWGARLLLAVDRDLPVTPDFLEGRHAIHHWLEGALQGRVSHVLQVLYKNVSDPASIDLDRLGEALGRARAHQAVLADGGVRQRPWRCVLDPEQRVLIPLLSPLVELRRSSEDGANLVVIVDRQLPGEQRSKVERVMRKHRNRSYLVGTLKVQTTVDLYSCCQDHALPEPLEFKGELELWYFLMRLNEEVPNR